MKQQQMKVPNSNGTQEPTPGKIVRQVLMWSLLLVSLVFFFVLTKGLTSQEAEITYSEYISFIEKDLVKEATIYKAQVNDFEFHGILREPVSIKRHNGVRSIKQFTTKLGLVDSETEKFWRSHKLTNWTYKNADSMFWNIVVSIVPWLLIIGVWIFFMKRMSPGGPKNIFSFGKARTKLMSETQVKITFQDVAGVDEAKEELKEIIEFLRNPLKFQKLGGKIPRGVLLLGPPGTGKTLLARAVAGEANVPFYSISGADFVEMFVGVGASRVRDLFEQANKNAPCIVFIDEIDAVGRHRGAGLGGGHDEREQTLNQLLVEMDGFEQNNGVIIVAATNRPDVLDPALLRPGRFDRQVVVDRPDVKGREGILKVHSAKVPLASDVNLETLARGTPGMSGADLANLVNEAALFAARRDSESVTMYDFESAKDKIIMGVERKSMVISDKEKEMTAYHEMGHALVGRLLPGGDPVHKVTIIPRGRALGVTSYLPNEDFHTLSKDYVETRIITLLAGRAAEQIIFNQLTTGAGNDIQRATELARKMVCEWGMSTALGPVHYANKHEEVFLGREINNGREHSESTANQIDTEVRRIIDDSSARAHSILNEHIELLHRSSKALLDREVIDGAELELLVEGKQLLPMNRSAYASPEQPTQTQVITTVNTSLPLSHTQIQPST